MSRLLWPGRPVFRSDYVSYGTGSHYRYSRPPPLPFTTGGQSGAYYGSRYHPASSGPDPWTPPPRMRSFADSYSRRRDGSSACVGRSPSASNDREACDPRSSGSRSRRSRHHDAVPPSPRRKSHGKHVHFADTVRCYLYRTEEPRQHGIRDEEGYGCDDRYDHYDYDRRRSRRERRSRSDREQEYEYSKSDRRPRDSYEEVYSRSPRAATAQRNNSRYEEASKEETHRRRRHGRRRRRSVDVVEVDVWY